MEKTKLTCPTFKLSGSLEISQWIKFFDRKCTENEVTPAQRCSLIADYLEDEALSFYISHCIDIEEWEKLKQKLTDHFTHGRDCTFEDLINTKFITFQDVTAYFNRKHHIGSKLGLEDNIIIQSLNHGLPVKYRDIMNSHDFPTTSEWIRVARRIITNSQPEAATPQNHQTNTYEEDRPSHRDHRSNQHPRFPSYQNQQRRPPFRSPPQRQHFRNNNSNWTRPSSNFR